MASAPELALIIVADFADDFDEDPEEEDPGPVLPREDRLWRHPSELRAEDFRSLDPVAVRRQWLQTQPTRASAWTAGLVGALLATGLVVLGTHLGGALTGGVSPASPSLSSAAISSIGTGAPVDTNSPMLGRFVSRSVKQTSGSIGTVSIESDGQHVNELALAINRSGFFLIPSLHLADASSILVTLSTGVQYVGSVVGEAPSLGISLLHLNGTIGLHGANFETSAEPDLAVAIVSATGKAAVTSLSPLRGHPILDGHRLSRAMVTDLATSTATPGTVLIDGSGKVTGMVVGSARGRVLAINGTDIAAAVRQLLNEQAFSERSLGLADTSVSNPPGAGARVVSVARGSASAQAGLRPGDVIVDVNGQAVTSRATFDAALRLASPQATLVLTVRRGTDSQTIVVPPVIAANG